jgi:hypothetical protein
MSALSDEQLVRYWLGGVNIYVQAKTAHLSDPGQLQLVGVTTGEPKLAAHGRFDIGDVDGMVEWAVGAAKKDLNVYISARTVRRGIPEGKFARETDTVWVWGFVIDYDGYGTVPFAETFRVQTSPGNAHYWYLTSMSLEQARLMSKRFKLVAKGDSCTGSIPQNYRVPGTPNYPTPNKVATGREIEPTFIIDESGPTYSFEQLNELLPPYTPPPVQHFDYSSVDFDDESGRSPDEVYEQLRQLQQSGAVKNGLDNFLEPTGKLVPDRQRNVPDRSRQFRHACLSAFENGFTVAEVYRFVLAKCPGGSARKFLERSLSDLAREIETHWRKHLQYRSEHQQRRQLLGSFLAKSGAGSSPQLNQSVSPQAVSAESPPVPHNDSD